MTKGEFIDEVAQRTGLSKKDAGAAVDAVLGTISDTLKSGGDVAFTGLRQVPRHEALGTHRREPAEPGSEGPDPGGDRAEVLRRLDAEGRSQGQVARPGGGGPPTGVPPEPVFAWPAPRRTPRLR